jgi:hypothetical protein
MKRLSLFNRDLTSEHSENVADIGYDQAITNAGLVKRTVNYIKKVCPFGK